MCQQWLDELLDEKSVKCWSRDHKQYQVHISIWLEGYLLNLTQFIGQAVLKSQLAVKSGQATQVKFKPPFLSFLK